MTKEEIEEEFYEDEDYIDEDQYEETREERYIRLASECKCGAYHIRNGTLITLADCVC